MKITKSQLKEMIREELLREGEAIKKVRDDYKSDRERNKQDFDRDLEDAEKEDLETRQKERNEGKLNEEPFSSPEAKKIMDQSLREYAKILRKAQYKVVKDWMTKAKAGVIDFFDVSNGLKKGDISRAYPYETDFLRSVLTKDKIVNRFRSYTGGRKRKR